MGKYYCLIFEKFNMNKSFMIHEYNIITFICVIKLIVNNINRTFTCNM
jgi:hypothetical protein